MRIIEPATRHKSQKKVIKKKRTITRPLVIVSGFLVISLLFLSLANSYNKTAQKHQDSNATLATSIEVDSSKVAGVSDSSFNYLTGDQIQKVYETIVYPNTLDISTPPDITGIEAADKRIRTIAESRGYKLRSVPKLPIVKTNESGLVADDLLQPKAYLSWEALKRKAESANIPLKLNSGYRSIELQKSLFLSRLSSAGVDASKIASGNYDDKIATLLLSTAPPGYSRHHNGYTMDFVCGNGQTSFKYTVCFDWLKKDNYKVAKTVGFLPSYPEGADDQGPEPEPWEYVWVGLQSLIY
jgi:LAS superfamily LD-carboxypeptidase LdcB